MSTIPAAPPVRPQREASRSLDLITASIVLRQSRTNDDSMSIPDQEEAARAWCAKQMPPVLVGSIYVEKDVSGRKPLDKRKGLHAAVVDVEEGRAQMLLTVYFDRFVRSVVTRAEAVQRVEKANGIVMTMDFGRTSNATAVDKLSGTMLAAIAEFYADQVGEKTAVTKQRNIDKGVPPFPRVTPAYVRRSDGTLTPHPVNGPLIATACQMRASGDSFAKIQRYLDENGLRIGVSGIESMLSSKLLIGEIHFGSFTPNLQAAKRWGGVITDRATWRKMQAAKVTRGRYSKSEHLLARQGVLVCATCGSRLVVHPSIVRGKRHDYYRCTEHFCSNSASVPIKIADDYLRDVAIELSKDVVGRASAKVELEAARVELEAAQDDLDNAIRTLLGRESRATAEVLDELTAARDGAEAKHHRLVALTAPDRTVRTTRDWDALTLDARRDLLQAMIARAEVIPGGGGNTRAASFDVTERIRVTSRKSLSE